MTSILFVVGGLAALLLGADLLVRGVSNLAVAAGVSPLIIGLTVVAFGTSTPEVVINVISAWDGQTELAYGNIVGSCAINIGFVLALTALIRPLNVESSIVSRELPLMLLAVAILWVLADDTLLNDVEADVLTRSDGVVLLLLFCVFLYSIVRTTLSARRDPLLQEVKEEVAREQKETPPAMRPKRNPWPSVAMTLVGLIGVAGGGRIAVIGAVEIAEAMGVSEVIIGLTVVSFGTTLPELATCVTAARRGQSDIALGNVVGSNIYNLLFIGGLVATINPIPIPAGGVWDVSLLLLLSIVLLPIAMRQSRVTRSEGGVLLLIYLAYLVWRLMGAR